jgi:hypothetical protein
MSGSRQARRRRTQLLLIAAIPLFVVAAYLATAPFVPDEIAGAYAIPGDTDPERPLFVAVLQGSVALIGAAVAIVGVVRTRVDETPPAYARIAVVAAVPQAALGVGALVGAIGADDYAESLDRWWVKFVCAAVFGFVFLIDLVGWSPSPVGQATLPVPPSSVLLAPHERVVWTGHARSRAAAVAAVVLSVATLVAGLVWSPVAMLLGVVPLLFAVANVSTTVVIDGDGVTFRRFGFAKSMLVAPLREIQSVEVVRVRPLMSATTADGGSIPYGRWHRLRAVVRGGEGILVRHGTDAVAILAVDHAAEGADVLNGLLARMRVDARIASSPTTARGIER